MSVEEQIAEIQLSQPLEESFLSNKPEVNLTYKKRDFIIRQNANQIFQKVNHTHRKSVDLMYQCASIQSNMDLIKKDIENSQFKCERYIDYKNSQLSDEDYKKLLEERKKEQERKKKQMQIAVIAGVQQSKRENMSKSQPENQKSLQLPEFTQSEQKPQPRIVRSKYFDYHSKRTAHLQKRQSLGVFTTQQSETYLNCPKIIICKAGPKGQPVKIDMGQVKKNQDKYIQSRSIKRRETLTHFRY